VDAVHFGELGLGGFSATKKAAGLVLAALAGWNADAHLGKFLFGRSEGGEDSR